MRTNRWLRAACASALVGALALAPALAITPAALASSVVAPPGGSTLAEKNAVLVHLGAGATAPPNPALSWMVADLTTGQVLAARNAHLELPPASTLKALLAVTVLPNLPPTQTYKATAHDVNAEGSKVGLTAGATYTIDELFYGLFLPSGNDAASAIAHANGGFPKTVAEMNTEAHQLQANDTHAMSPSGLDTPHQFSSAYDLALFAQQGLTNTRFATYCRTVSYRFPAPLGVAKAGGGRTKPTSYMIYNENKLLTERYRGTIGVKTGYTTDAGRTYIGAVTRGGHTLVVTMMKVTSYSEPAAKALFNWGFDNLNKVTPVGTLAQPLSTAVAQPPAAAPATAGISGTGAHPRSVGAIVWLTLLLVAIGIGAFAWTRRHGEANLREPHLREPLTGLEHVTAAHEPPKSVRVIPAGGARVVESKTANDSPAQDKKPDFA